MVMVNLISPLLEFAEKLDVIQAVKNKLIRQPDPAADKLVIVLEELSKIYTAIETELVRYLSLSFDRAQVLKEIIAERAQLLMLEGGQVEARISEARGHCHKIANIYDRFLNVWFQKVLSPDESGTLGGLFDRINDADRGMVFSLNEVGRWLTAEASATLNLVDNDKFDEANKRIRVARKEVLPIRQAIAKAMSDLRQLQSEFIDISSAL